MSLAYAHADRWSLRVAKPLLFVRRLFHPLTFVMGRICERILDLLGRASPKPLMQDEFVTYLDSCVARGAFSKRQADLLKETFSLRVTQLDEVMLARVDLVCVKYGEPADAVADKIRRSHQAFMPVCTDDIDNADALLDSLDFFRLAPQERTGWANSRALLRKVPSLPKHTTLNKALATMRQKSVLAAFVVDEYGGVNGIISIQDIYSEVAGDSVELTERAFQTVTEIRPGQWLFDGSCTLDFVRENSAWRDCNQDGAFRAATLNGLFCEAYGCLPEPGTDIRIDDFTLKAVSVSRNRITKILIRRNSGRKAVRE